MKKILIIILVFIVISVLLLIKVKIDENESYLKHIYSHRGASSKEIEHTIKAYDLAIEYGSKYIEQDIVISKDGTLFVSHDLSAKRITGINKLYENLTDSEIKKLKTKDKQNILKLEEVFKKYKKDINYVIELKDKKGTKELIRLIKKYKLEKKVIVQCFHKDVLKDIKKEYPKMPTLYLIEKQDIFEEGLNITYVDIISINKNLMTKKNVEKAHKYKKEINVWTLDSEEEIKKAIMLNVDSYFTNYTDRAIKLEKKYRK